MIEMEQEQSNIPVLRQTLPDFVARNARIFGDEIAFVEEDRSVTWRAFGAKVNAVSAALAKSGVKKGDCVCLLSGNSAWAYEVMFGIFQVGGIYTPLTPLLTPSLIATQLRDCEASIMFVGDGMDELATNALEYLAPDMDIRVVRQNNDDGIGCAYGEFLATGADYCSSVAILPTDIATLIYSSGTTGAPKGILHTHEARLNMAMCLAVELGFSSGIRTIIATPPFTNGTLICLLPTIIRGGTALLMKKFGLVLFTEMVKLHRPTHVFLVPTILRQMLNNHEIRELDMSCFQTVVSAGAPLDENMKLDLAALFGPGFSELWGLTEGLATFVTSDDLKSRPGSVGRPLMGTELRLIDEQDNIVEHGIGEIVGRSSYLMQRYHNRPSATGDIQWFDQLRNVYIRSGDLGEIDSEGFLILRGRKKDMIISGGINIYAQDLEMVLMRHPSVLDAAVVGKADDKWGEVPLAHILLKSGSIVSAGELMDWSVEHLAKHQKISEIIIHSCDFPRNALGKVIKPALENYSRNKL